MNAVIARRPLFIKLEPDKSLAILDGRPAVLNDVERRTLQLCADLRTMEDQIGAMVRLLRLDANIASSIVQKLISKELLVDSSWFLHRLQTAGSEPASNIQAISVVTRDRPEQLRDTIVH